MGIVHGVAKNQTQLSNETTKKRLKTRKRSVMTECVCPSQMHMLKPSPHVMVLGGGAFGGQLGLEEVTWVEPP